ncbi:MAG TPA: AraC family transcriptional regulator ligand-binding domain-containing protein [Polyangiaceae bacterium]|nr:AraC family transcriptional regulator ligand-binding domain-containing protein [Polyangiaceae bacterium]
MTQTRSGKSPRELLLKGGRQALEACGVDLNQFDGAVDALIDAKSDDFWGGLLGAQRTQRAAAVLAELSGDPQLGLRLASTIPQGSLGILEYILKTSDTLRSALEYSCRFAPLVADYVRLELHAGPGMACLRFVPDAGIELHPLVVDYRLARTVHLSREVANEPSGAPAEVHFSYARPANLQAYRDMFGENTRLVFGQDFPELRFEAEVLARTLPGADPVLNGILVEHAQALLGAAPASDSIRARLERELAATLHAQRPSLAALARRLRLSERTLRRRLADEGTSFNALVDGVRASLAVLYARDRRASAEYIAEKLGFESDSAYRRAFRRWKERGLV